MAGLIFSVTRRKTLEPMATPGFVLGGGNVAWRIAQMTESLLDECYESILKIAETQPHDGKRAILALAEMFRNNSRRCSATASLHCHKTFVRLIASGYLLAGFDRVRLLDKRLDPVFPPRLFAIGYASRGSLAIRHHGHAQQG
jgi:hypothetical protein